MKNNREALQLNRLTRKPRLTCVRRRMWLPLTNQIHTRAHNTHLSHRKQSTLRHMRKQHARMKPNEEAAECVRFGRCVCRAWLLVFVS